MTTFTLPELQHIDEALVRHHQSLQDGRRKIRESERTAWAKEISTLIKKVRREIARLKGDQ